jgi:hypothetical protein
MTMWNRFKKLDLEIWCMIITGGIIILCAFIEGYIEFTMLTK